MSQYLRALAFDNEQASRQDWQDRVRDPSLTVLLALQVFLIFLALPFATTGGLIAGLAGQSLLLVLY